MTRPDLEKLLGGYAAGTLTPEERRALLDAALSDQSLFDALADEEPLREVLADPACRERVHAALTDEPRAMSWLRRPAVWALAATAAAAVVLTVMVLRPGPVPPVPQAPRQSAMTQKPPAAEVAPPAPASEPKMAPKAEKYAPAAPPRAFVAPPPPPPPRQAAPVDMMARPPSNEPGAAGGVAAAPPPSFAAKSALAAPLRAQFENKLDKAKQSEPAFGLRYTLLRNGEEVPPETRFARGESAGLRIEADRSGYLYVIAGKRALFSGSVEANQPVVIETRPGLLHLVLLPEPDPGPLKTLTSRVQQQNANNADQLSRRRDQAGILADVSINSR